MARSRNERSVEPAVARISRSTSSGSRKSTWRIGVRPISIFSGDSVAMSCFARNLRKERMTTA